MNTALILSLLALSLGGLKYTGTHHSLFSVQEKKLSDGFKFLGLLAMYEAVFGTNTFGLITKPKKLEKFLDHPLSKFVLLFFVSFGLTHQFEQSLFIVTSFLLVIQLIRTDEERKKHPLIL